MFESCVGADGALGERGCTEVDHRRQIGWISGSEAVDMVSEHSVRLEMGCCGGLGGDITWVFLYRVLRCEKTWLVSLL